MTLAACVIGYPVKHSRSPMLHGHWIAEHGLDAVYRAEEVSPQDAREFIANLAAHGYTGANVTIPHKELAFEIAAADVRAEAVGAANTLWYDGGRLCATNTDVEGFLGSLDSAAEEWAADEAVVIGAGGAARAVIYGLIERGVGAIHVVNRTRAKADALRERFGACVRPADWDILSGLLPSADLLINTTSLGMHGEPPLAIDLDPLKASALVADIVYVPLQTPLLAAARERGHATANGLDMLLHQAVRGFELWFGVRPRVTRELYDLLARDIAGA